MAPLPTVVLSSWSLRPGDVLGLGASVVAVGFSASSPSGDDFRH